MLTLIPSSSHMAEPQCFAMSAKRAVSTMENTSIFLACRERGA